MNISQNAIEMIAGFEGLRRGAYLDPAGIPTIGYGTIRYLDGTPVRMGDRISEAEAEQLLAIQAAGMATEVSKLVGAITLNQNQFDALVSFTYNLGPGALRSSTLLVKLKASDFSGAAQEFEKWNKATVGGVKKVLPGLTVRRQTERALFERKGEEGEPLPHAVSVQDQAVRLVGFRDGSRSVIVAQDTSGKAVEIVEMEDDDLDSLGALLRLYSNAKTFEIASATAAIPAGPRTSFVLRDRLIQLPQQVPVLAQALLIRGNTDEDTGTNDVSEMQTRLQELGLYHGRIDGVFGSGTDDAVRIFQAQAFGQAEADGRVGPKTWAKLFGTAGAAPPPPIGAVKPGLNYLRLTRTHRRDQFGLDVLDLSYFKDGQKVDSLSVCSGIRSHQEFRKAVNSFSGSHEPIHEGRWTISGVKWCDGKDNYEGRVWSNGLGPAKIFMCYEEPGSSRRANIEIHIDWNRRGSPGSDGCIAIYNQSDFKRLVGWLRDSDPRSVYVDWELGTCPTPKAPEALSTAPPCVWDANGR